MSLARPPPMATRASSARLRSLPAIAFAVAALGGDCDGDIVSDPTFRDWCGDQLCAWKTEQGVVRPVASWDDSDRAVGFMVSGTEISQATTESAAKCILFGSVADLDTAADMTISVDFNSDGTVEYVAPLGATYWERVETEITAPKAYRGITFKLQKAGNGTAALAEMRIQSTTGCTAPPVVVAAGTLHLGDRCSDSADCAAGLVCAGVAGSELCSQCAGPDQCPAGVDCATPSPFLPALCGPGRGLGAPGQGCLSPGDCASGVCDGASPIPLVASDAGACDLDAPLGASNPANCRDYGARGGQCR